MRHLVIFTAIIACGLALALYPTAQRWVHDYQDYTSGGQYRDALDSVSPAVRSDLLATAAAYNTSLPVGVTPRVDADAAIGDRVYQEALRIPRSELIGEVRAPSIDLVVPVYRGTSDAVLEKGAGHMYGTSLPVGGPSTHTVISAHSSRVGPNRFTRLGELRLGDDFYLRVAGETLRYVVDQIEVVTPDDVSDLQIAHGKDYATLLTCIPISINSHRLLVRGERAPLDPESLRVADGARPAFPWWAAGFVGGVAAAAGAGRLFLGSKRKQAPASPSTLIDREARPLVAAQHVVAPDKEMES